MVPHKEIQWHNGTPQEKFYSLATFGHNREDNQVPHKCHVEGVGVQGWPYPPRTFFLGTIGPRESVLCSQRSSDVIRVQSLWECVKYRDKGKNNRGPRRVWSFTNICEFV